MLTLRRVHETIVAVQKAVIITYWCVCVHACACVRTCGCMAEWACACAHVHIAFLIQHATRMRHVVMSFVAPLSPLYFSTLSHKR
jgi:hypothetical protein